MTMLDAMGQTAMGGSRLSKDAANKGHYYLRNDVPIVAGSGITLEYVDLTTGYVIDPNLVPWNSPTKYALKISVAAVAQP